MQSRYVAGRQLDHSQGGTHPCLLLTRAINCALRFAQSTGASSPYCTKSSDYGLALRKARPGEPYVQQARMHECIGLVTSAHMHRVAVQTQGVRQDSAPARRHADIRARRACRSPSKSHNSGRHRIRTPTDHACTGCALPKLEKEVTSGTWSRLSMSYAVVASQTRTTLHPSATLRAPLSPAYGSAAASSPLKCSRRRMLMPTAVAGQ